MPTYEIEGMKIKEIEPGKLYVIEKERRKVILWRTPLYAKKDNLTKCVLDENGEPEYIESYFNLEEPPVGDAKYHHSSLLYDRALPPGIALHFRDIKERLKGKDVVHIDRKTPKKTQ